MASPASRDGCGPALTKFADELFLSQIVNVHTRDTATLDLILVSHTQGIGDVLAHDTNLSDHKIVEANFLFDAQSSLPERAPPEFDPLTFRALDIHGADTQHFQEALAGLDWKYLHDICQDAYGEDCVEEYAELVRLVVLQVALNNIPHKKPPVATKPTASRHRHVLYRKRRKLNTRLKALKAYQPTSPTIKKIEHELCLLEYNLREHINHELNAKEKKALSKITENPRFFFSYAKKFSKLRSNIGPLRDADGDLHHQPNEMADLLQSQYEAVFSDPNAAEIDHTCKHVPQVETDLSEIPINEKDMAEAMKELNPYSSAPDGEIPARILKDCRESLCVPLTILWKQSFNCGKIPVQFKMQFIAPIFKKDDKTDPANYRPVSLTSHIIKIFERVVRKYMVEYLESNNLLSNKQHGFRKGRSCLTQLLNHIEEILQNQLRGEETDVIYLDYAKAFDKVDHDLLLLKLWRYGIKGKLHTWLSEFLKGRQQIVVVDGQHSRPAPVISGVPQGTVLGPILFLVYLNEISSVLQHSLGSSFADDTRLMKAVNGVTDTFKLQSDLNSVVQYSKENNMKLHENKFELLSYRNNTSTLRELPYAEEFSQYLTPGGFLLQPKPTVKDLGVNLSDNLSWSPHISKIAADAKKMASWVLGVFQDRSIPTMLHLYKSLIRCRLEYCSPVWSPSSTADIQKLEEIQRFFTKKIAGLSTTAYHDRLAILRLQSLQRRRERYRIIHMWKILHHQVPNDLGTAFHHHPRLGTRANVPPLNKRASAAAQSLYEQSFSVNAAKLWNILPADINLADKLDTFKTKLGKYLESFPDNPPCSGLATANNNSLLEWYQSGYGGLRMKWRP